MTYFENWVEQGGATRRSAAGRAPQVPRVDVAKALRGGGLIAVFKRVCALEGPLNEGANPRDFAAAAVEGGAVAVGAATDAAHHGQAEDLVPLRRTVSVPVLDWGWATTGGQLEAAFEAGADGVRIVVETVAAPNLRRLIDHARGLGLEPICEAHELHGLDRAMAAGARVLAFNPRDPADASIDLDRFVDARKAVPRSRVLLLSGGVRAPTDLRRGLGAQADAVVLSTMLMLADRPDAALGALRDD